MPKEVYYVADAFYCALGNSWNQVKSACANLQHGLSAVKIQENASTHYISVFDAAQKAEISKGAPDEFSFFEQLLHFAVKSIQEKQGIDSFHDTQLIISSTKGNIEFIQQKGTAYNLYQSAQKIAQHFGFAKTPIVISNACISGSLALQTGKRLIENNLTEQALVVGADCVSEFVWSGFNAFQALSDKPCRPFDKDRKGINLGEAVAAILLSANPGSSAIAQLSGARANNDANHLSGPSKTGEELGQAIVDALSESQISADEIGAISCHGTATNYNDEMESKALHFAQVNHAPVHSFKSFIGHTLGAAGILESIVACHSMQESLQLPSLNFSTSGVSCPIQVNTQLKNADYTYLLKTASGFGGCNAALVWKKAI